MLSGVLMLVGADGTLRKLAHTKAAAQGFPIPLENMIMSGSHSHSGPGGITPEFLWEFAPATDLIVPGKVNVTHREATVKSLLNNDCMWLLLTCNQYL